MKLDEFAFFNQQLAAMLRDGIPLEGALRQLSETMARGKLRDELSALEADLARGTPLEEALAARKLPELYVKMLQVGVKSGDLPGVLTMLADYYHRINTLWARLNGLMVYPLIVLGACLGVSVLFAVIFSREISQQTKMFDDLLWGGPLPTFTRFALHFAPVCLWAPVGVVGILFLAVSTALAHSGTRRWLRWHVPLWRDVSVWQFASAMGMMLRGGCRLDEALALMVQFEAESPAAADLLEWEQRLARGLGDFRDFASASRVFPPLFVWLVAVDAENLASGFARAEEMYHGRAVYGSERLLYAVLPVSVLFLGALVFSQVFALVILVLGGFIPMV